MSMQVQAELYRPFVSDLLHYFFCFVELGVYHVGGVFPASVYVVSSDVASEVAVNHPVDIQHREYMEVEGLEQTHTGLIRHVSQLYEEIFEDERGPDFT